MNCVNHPETEAVAYCRTCGKALCNECQHAEEGTIFCEEHRRNAVAPMPPRPSQGSYYGEGKSYPGSPALAALLGFIPGVGAIYNGQYAKGLVHAIIFGLLISIVSSGGAGGLEPLFGILIAVWEFYMVFEAYHTARKRRDGEPVDEFSSLFEFKGGVSRFPGAAVVLIVLGIVLLLRTMDVIDFRAVARYWPVVLIAAGVFMLYGRISGTKDEVDNARR